MARTARIKTTGIGVSYYHLMSRTNNKAFLFGSPEVKDAMMAMLRRTAEFCGVKVDTCVIMSNHFHVLVRVERTESQVDEAELIRRIKVLRGEKRSMATATRWKDLAASGRILELEAEQAKLRRRMNDISEYMKLFKEEFDRYYKRRESYCGSIWSGRFTSTLVESGEYVNCCRQYILHNPVRAGIVSIASDYRWCWSLHKDAGTDPKRECRTDTNDRETILENVNARYENAERVSRWQKRIVQIGAGKVFGSAAFVDRMRSCCGSKFAAKRVSMYPVGKIGYTTHGWKLAKALMKRSKGSVAA